MDIRNLCYLDGSVSVIAAIHVIEHFYRWEVPDVLKEWHRALRFGGELILELPCMNKVFGYIAVCVKKGIEISPRMTFDAIYGDHKTQRVAMTHKWGYSQEELKGLMEEAGFTVRIEEPRYHFPIRDMRLVGVK